jgi:hypothetical protein
MSKRQTKTPLDHGRFIPPHGHSIADLPIGTGPGSIPTADAALPLVLSRRITLAELPAALSVLFTFGTIPANRVVQSAFLFVTDAPAGGGVTTCLATVAPSTPPGAVYIETAELVGFAFPAYYTKYTGDPSAFELTAGDVHDVDRSVAAQFSADVNLDTLTNFDVTAYVVVSPALLPL